MSHGVLPCLPAYGSGAAGRSGRPRTTFRAPARNPLRDLKPSYSGHRAPSREPAQGERRRASQPVVFRVARAPFHQVERVGVARARAAVGAAQVREQAVEDDERALPDFERDETFGRPRRLVVALEARAAARGAHAARLEPRPVPAGERPEAAVLPGRVFEREPQTRHALRLGVEERGVLVARHLAAYQRLLEDVHGLDEQRPRVAERAGERGDERRAREALEDRVEVVERVADLVYRARLLLDEPPRRVERALLEEEAHLVARVEEIVVAAARLLAGGEDREDFARLESLHELAGAGAQAVALRGVGE